MTITARNTFSAGNAPVLRATSDSAADEYETVTLTIDNSSLDGPPSDTVITATCLAGDIYAPVAPISFTQTNIKEGDTSGVLAGNTYNIVPQMVQCHNGDILAVWTTGSSHFSDSDNVVSMRLPAGADYQTGWGSETLIIENPDHATDNAGMRFQGGGFGVDPDTGRLWLFVLHRETSPSWIIRNLYTMYSDDHGVTWSTPVDIYPQFTYPKYKDHAIATLAPHTVPFGRIVKTNLGLICPMYCPGKQCWIAVSADGNTWDESDFVMVDDYDGSQVLNEPNIVDFGDGRLVIVMRDDADDWKATYSKSSDHGATWSAFVTTTPYYDLGIETPPSGAASIQVNLINDRVYMFTTAREPVDKYIEYVCEKEEFWTDPASLWNPSRTPNISRTTSVSPLGAHYLNAGYGSILPIAGHEYTTLLAYYTPDGGSSDITNISVKTMVKV